MANNEKLIFPIGFDLEEGVKQVQKDWKKHQPEIQKTIDRNPLKLKLELSAKDFNISELKKYIGLSREIAKANREIAKTRSANALAAQRESRQRVQEATELDQIKQKKAQASLTEERLVQAKQRSANATERQNSAYKTQSGYLQRLFQRMVAYASVTQAFSFIRNIREVTAQFELQRVALGSIIGDLNEANAMFEQIKAAAVKSPFQIKELVTYTKQLAAYKIESNELFETTQRLADVSAGLGVGMERLVLAYGQIRATGYLRASEVRQLTEAGIPIVEELAKKMSELRGETVSAAEVMGLISERAISFGMVKEVFDDMTSAGGMFYKMQEKQAETLQGQWNNLKDSIAIMYEEIGNTEGVNNSIKGMIGLVKSLAENWRDVWSVVQSLSAAMGVYYVAMKNAAVASKALTIAEATRLAVENKQMIIIPKWLAFFDRKNRLYKVSIVLEKALALAQLKTATATNVLSKGFWKLTAAMLSNPYTAVLAALGGLATLLLTTENRAKRLSKELAKIDEDGAIQIDQSARNFERLAKAVRESADGSEKQTTALAELKRSYGDLLPSQDEEIKALVQEKSKYDALIGSIRKKIELQIQEQKLNTIASEYGSRFTKWEGKIKKESIFGSLSTQEIDIFISEIKKAVDEGLIATSNDAETNGLELKRILEGIVGDAYGSLSNTYFANIKSIRKLIETQEEYNKSIDSVGGALDRLDDKGKNLSDTFNTWQKELANITEGKNLKGEGIRLFDDESISQINKLTDATARVAEEYDKLAKEKKEVDKALKSEGAKADKGTYAKLQERLGKINEGMSGLYGFLKKYGALDLIKSDDKTQKSAEQALKDELVTVEKIYKRYQDLRKLKSESDTQAILAKEFKGVNLETLEKAYSPEQMLEVYQKALAEAQRLGKTDLVLEIQTKIGEFNIAEEQRNLEKSLKDLSDKISRTKTAKEFFDRMLGMTGDRELSATLTMSVYGTTGDDLKSALVKQVEQAFKGVDVSGAIDYNTMTINYQKLAEIYAKNQDKILDANKSMAESIVKDGQKTSASQIEQWAKELEAVKTYADKRVDIARQTQQRISEIEASTLPEDEKQRLQEQYRKKEGKDLAKLEYQAFKESPMYVAMFDNLDSASTTMLNNMRTKLMELKEAWGGLDMPTELKEMQSRLNEIDKQLASRNPFRTLANAYKGYQELREKGSRKEAEQDLIDETEKHAKAVGLLDMLTRSATQAQQEYNDAVEKYGEDSDQAKSAKKMLEYSNILVDAQTESVNATEKGVEASQELINKWKELDDVVGGTWVQVNTLTQAIINLGRNLADAFGGFGSDADAEYFNNMADAFSNLVDGASNIATGIATSNPISVINGIGSLISGLVEYNEAQTFKENNREIERQQKILDNLSIAYEKLEKEVNDTFGSDRIKNYNDRLAILQAQQEAYQKQAEEERAKGKKADEAKVEAYEEGYRKATDNIKDMQSELSEYFLGTDLTSAARDFANAWIEAYKEFGSTTDAMKEKFHDMIQNMVVESIAGRMMQELLRPVFDEIGRAAEDGELDEREITNIADMSIGLIDAVDECMTNLMERLRGAGYDIRQSTSGLTGISRDIATASEESILGLAAGINTQNFYISQVPPKLDTIIALLQGGGVQTGGGVDMQGLITIQNQHLSYLPTIAQHTAETVAECKAIVVETRRTADALDKVIKPRGTQSSYTINTTLN